MSGPTTRVRGLAPWSPRSETRVLLDQVRDVLTEYQAHLPLTIRQVFYRLVGAHRFEKTERAYKRLYEHLNRARRAGLIEWSVLRDDGITWEEAPGWDSPAELVRTFVHAADTFRLHRQDRQRRRLFFAVEAAGMVPQIVRLAAPFGIDVHSTGGFDSTTAKYSLAQRLGAYDAVEVLHLGDHDPSGVHLFSCMAQDVASIAQDLGLTGDIRFTRLVVTPEQMATYDLPTSPPKPTDHRAFEGETTQAEALPPDVVAIIVREAIEKRLDYAAFQAVLAAEAEAKLHLSRRLQPLLRDLDGAP
jgi:hypothetical protein